MIRAVYVLFLAVISVLSAASVFANEEIVVYSARGEHLIQPLSTPSRPRPPPPRPTC